MSPVTAMATSVTAPDDAERQQVAALGEFLDRHPASDRGGTSRLVSADGEEVEVPPHLFGVLRHIATILGQGNGVVVSAVAQELSTTEAARALGMSRPTLIRLLDEGNIPSRRVGSHRRVLLHDVLDFRRQQIHQRRRSYEALMLESDALGLNADE